MSIYVTWGLSSVGFSSFSGNISYQAQTVYRGLKKIKLGKLSLALEYSTTLITKHLIDGTSHLPTIGALAVELCTTIRTIFPKLHYLRGYVSITIRTSHQSYHHLLN